MTDAEWEHRVEGLRLARRVKIADRVSNVQSCRVSDDRRHRMYVKEYPAFVEALRVPGEWDDLWTVYDGLITP